MRSGRLAVWLGLAGVLLGSRVEAQSLTPGPARSYLRRRCARRDERHSRQPRAVSRRSPTEAACRHAALASTSAVTSISSTSVLPESALGVNFIDVRGTATDANATMNVVAPQLSFNFGTSDGWSYLSVGAGTARVNAEATGSSSAINAGGGARWFMKRHLAVGFDSAAAQDRRRRRHDGRLDARCPPRLGSR